MPINFSIIEDTAWNNLYCEVFYCHHSTFTSWNFVVGKSILLLFIHYKHLHQWFILLWIAVGFSCLNCPDLAAESTFKLVPKCLDISLLMFSISFWYFLCSTFILCFPHRSPGITYFKKRENQDLGTKLSMLIGI